MSKSPDTAKSIYIYMENNLLCELANESPASIEKMITDVEILGELGLSTAGKISDLLKRLASMPVNSVAFVDGPIACPSNAYAKRV